MKKLFLLSAIIAALPTIAQTYSGVTSKKSKPYVIKGKTLDGRFFKGLLYSADDSTIFLTPSTNPNVLRSPHWKEISIPVANIQSFTTVRKNSGLKGALFGIGIGMITGMIVGFAEGDDALMSYPDPANDPWGLGTFTTAINNELAMTAEAKAAAYGISLGITGALTGAVIGAIAKKKFFIHGKRKNYRDLQGDLMRRLLLQ